MSQDLAPFQEARAGSCGQWRPGWRGGGAAIDPGVETHGWGPAGPTASCRRRDARSPVSGGRGAGCGGAQGDSWALRHVSGRLGWHCPLSLRSGPDLLRALSGPWHRPHHPDPLCPLGLSAPSLLLLRTGRPSPPRSLLCGQPAEDWPEVLGRLRARPLLVLGREPRRRACCLGVPTHLSMGAAPPPMRGPVPGPTSLTDRPGGDRPRGPEPSTVRHRRPELSRRRDAARPQGLLVRLGRPPERVPTGGDR